MNIWENFQICISVPLMENFIFCAVEPGSIHEPVLLTLIKCGSRSKFFCTREVFFQNLYPSSLFHQELPSCVHRSKLDPAKKKLHQKSPLVFEAFRGLGFKNGKKACLGIVVKNLLKFKKKMQIKRRLSYNNLMNNYF